jgi:Uma2 family endonuclease
VEILSHSSVRKDKRVLPVKYYEAGITEYWLIDCRSDDAMTFQILGRGAEGFEPVAADRDGFCQSTALPYRFRLVRGRDEFGFWKYRLEHRPTSAPA